MSGSGGDAREQALEGARRVYDRQVERLDRIDDLAMRTTRLSVLILGFIAAALTAGGPDAVSDLHLVPVMLGAVGAACIFAAAFIGVGIFSVTVYPVDLRDGDIRAASRVSEDDWIDGTVGHLRYATGELEAETRQNAEYFGLALFFLIVGSLLLVLATMASVVNQSYGIRPSYLLLGLLSLAGIVLLVGTSLMSDEQ